MHLIFDTETTGKVNFKLPHEDPSQPRLVQLAALLLDKDFKEVSSFNLIIKPDHYTIPDEVAAIHGITTSHANQYGVSEKAVLLLFSAFCKRATTLVAHNIAFDSIIIKHANSIHQLDFPQPPLKFCTMSAMTPICKLPGQFGKCKWPTLAEAYQHVTSKPHIKAHNALYDVKACATIYSWLQTNHSNNLTSLSSEII